MIDEADIYWRVPKRARSVGSAHRRRRATSPATMEMNKPSECPDAARFRAVVRARIGDRRYANLIDPLAVRVDGLTVRLIGSTILRDCLEQYGPVLGRAAQQVLGDEAICVFSPAPSRLW